MSGILEAAIWIAVIAWLAAALLLIIWIRTWYAWRRERLAQQQRKTDMLMRRGFRLLQRQHPEDLQ